MVNSSSKIDGISDTSCCTVYQLRCLCKYVSCLSKLTERCSIQSRICCHLTKQGSNVISNRLTCKKRLGCFTQLSKLFYIFSNRVRICNIKAGNNLVDCITQLLTESTFISERTCTRSKNGIEPTSNVSIELLIVTEHTIEAHIVEGFCSITGNCYDRLQIVIERNAGLAKCNQGFIEVLIGSQRCRISKLLNALSRIPYNISINSIISDCLKQSSIECLCTIDHLCKQRLENICEVCLSLKIRRETCKSRATELSIARDSCWREDLTLYCISIALKVAIVYCLLDSAEPLFIQLAK